MAAQAPLRAETTRLVRLAEGDLTALWRLVAQGASAEVALRDLLPAIIVEYGQAGAALAAEWYDQQRDKAGVAKAFTAMPVTATDRGAHALIGWALNTATDDASLQTLIAGGTQRRIVDHARLTITDAATADPSAKGWQRVGSGECAFCAMLIGRGAVYSKATADFASHDHCHCSAVPVWGGQPLPVRPYTPANRNITDADRTRVKAWIAANT